MAGDWVKMRTQLLTSPKINGIARLLERSREVAKVLAPKHDGVMCDIVTRSVMRHVTVSSLLVIWGAANEHTRNGVFSNADPSDIDDMVGIPGFGEAMASVGWLVYDPEKSTVELPGFEEYNTAGKARGAGAKTGAERQREYRERKKAEKQGMSPSGPHNEDLSGPAEGVSRDGDGVTSRRDHREEKRREDITTPHNPPGGDDSCDVKPCDSDDRHDPDRDDGETRGGSTTGRAGRTSTGGGRSGSGIGLKAWIAQVKAKGEKPIPEGDKVFEYAQTAGIPPEFLHLAWREFQQRYGDGNAKRYKDWRAVFRKSVRGNWLKLWFVQGNTYLLTTAGEQARMAYAASAPPLRVPAEEGVPA